LFVLALALLFLIDTSVGLLARRNKGAA